MNAPHYHVVDMWCGLDRGQDYGAVPSLHDADRAIDGQRAAGNKGGCRHPGSGWIVRVCRKVDQCSVYDPTDTSLMPD